MGAFGDRLDIGAAAECLASGFISITVNPFRDKMEGGVDFQYFPSP